MSNKKRLYLAYGSNMHEGQMSYRCPRAKLLGKTVIKDYELLDELGDDLGKYFAENRNSINNLTFKRNNSIFSR